MRLSQYFLPTVKEIPADADTVSHQLMLRSGMIRKLSSGLYTWLPLGLRVLRKVEAIVREEMNRIGALEILMPAVQPAELWEETDRWDKFGPLLLKIMDRNKRQFCFGPTHEEVVTDLMRKELRSYKQLPIAVYQIQTKFRDEIRPRFGVMRAREFLMKDAYSFHQDEASLRQTYQHMHEAYLRIFTRIGLDFRAVQADNGSIGGNCSQEFHVLAETGEDQLLFSDTSDFAVNVEVLPNAKAGDPSPDGQGRLLSARGIEVGHIFQLGAVYSQKMGATILNEQGESVVMPMGCYGIGVSRIVAAAIEQRHDQQGIIWSPTLAPFAIGLIGINQHKSERVRKACEQIYAQLQQAGFEVLYDDRNERPGVMFAGMELIGIPRRLVISDSLLDENRIEHRWRTSSNNETIELTNLLSFLQQ